MVKRPRKIAHTATRPIKRLFRKQTPKNKLIGISN